MAPPKPREVIEYEFNSDIIPSIDECKTEWDYIAYGYNQSPSKIYAFMDSYLITLDPHRACIEAGIPSILAPRIIQEECVKEALQARMSTLSKMTDAPSEAIQGMALSKATTINQLKELLTDKGDLNEKVLALKELLNEL